MSTSQHRSAARRPSVGVSRAEEVRLAADFLSPPSFCRDCFASRTKQSRLYRSMRRLGDAAIAANFLDGAFEDVVVDFRVAGRVGRLNGEGRAKLPEEHAVVRSLLAASRPCQRAMNASTAVVAARECAAVCPASIRAGYELFGEECNRAYGVVRRRGPRRAECSRTLDKRQFPANAGVHLPVNYLSVPVSQGTSATFECLDR